MSRAAPATGKGACWGWRGWSEEHLLVLLEVTVLRRAEAIAESVCRGRVVTQKLSELARRSQTALLIVVVERKGQGDVCTPGKLE